MRTLPRLLVPAALAAFALVAARLAPGDDGKGGTPPPMHQPQKAIHQPFLDALAGSWTTSSTSTYQGKKHSATGKATFSLGVGGTALLEDYESTGDGPDGKPMTFSGHGIYKLADDGKAVTAWWLDSYSAEPMKLSGTASDAGLELAGENPMHGKMTLSLAKTADGLSFKITFQGGEMNESYKRAP